MHKHKFYLLGNSNGAARQIQETPPSYFSKRQHKVISLFSGAMGLDLGLEHAGFTIVGCLELDPVACSTIHTNRPQVTVINDDIRNWDGEKLANKIGISKEDVTVVVGGPPCPSFSTAGRRQSFNDPRGQVMFDFLRIVKELRPPFFVMENVRGILSASLSHRPLAERNQQNDVLTPEELPGSVMRRLNKEFSRMGYTVTAELVNAADYGTPQSRERVVFIGSRDGLQITMPVGNFSKNGGLFQQRWRTLGEAIHDLREKQPEYMPFSPKRLEYLKLLSEGQNWRSLPANLIKAAMGGAYASSGGKVGFYRRLSYQKPCPTVPTSPVQKSTCICHPKELRPLSIREYARVQQFPDDWKFSGSIADKYRQIGNAVPVGLGYHIGQALLRYLNNYEVP